jgi:hypothetical protein
MREGRPAEVVQADVAASRGGPAPTRQQQVRLTPTAASFDPRLPFDAWQELGRKVGRHANATGWWLGDWLAFGRFKYGRRYRDAVAATGLDYQTLRNYAAVARRFEPSRRWAELSFQHHADVCGLPDEEQDRLLSLSASRGWSRNELRRHARSSSGRRGDVARVSVVALSVGVERTERWRSAAERVGCSFEEWAVRTLDEAASAHDQR